LKQNVKDLNNGLKKEIFLSINAVEVMLRENIEDFSANLKENLKSYYKTMNEKQTNFLQEIKAIDEECQHKKKRIETKRSHSRRAGQ